MESKLRHMDQRTITGRKRDVMRRDVMRRDVMRRGVVLIAAAALCACFAGNAAAGKPAFLAKNAAPFVSTSLVAKATANPDQYFEVIVRGRPGESSASIASKFP